MAWVIAIGGIILLIVLHEAGHFLAAKAVGMRVERFSLFFPPTIARFTRGETEYALGLIPAGGYVKITGMSPEELEDLDPELHRRAYYAQKPWKRIVVILAGPGTNLLIALVLFSAVLWSGSLAGATSIEQLAPSVTTVVRGTSVVELVLGDPAIGKLKLGDRIVSVDGHAENGNGIIDAIVRDRCTGRAVQGCRAAAPLRFGVDRDGSKRTVSIYPRYEKQAGKMMVGVELAKARSFGLFGAVGAAGATMWDVTTSTVTGLGHAITSSKVRSHLTSIVGIAQDTEEDVAAGPGYGFVILAFVSMVLGVINLFPFLPLDGGHVLWSVAEKVRGGRVSTQAMWRFSSVGIVLLLFLVVNGISNDVSRLTGG